MFAVISREFTITRLQQTNSQKKFKRITMMIETEDKELRFDTRGTLHDQQKRRRTMSPNVNAGNVKAATKKKSRWFPFMKSQKLDKQGTRGPPSAADVSVTYHLGTDEQDWSETSRESVTRSRGPVPVPPTQTNQDEQGGNRERVPALHPQADTEGQHWDETDGEPCYRDPGQQQTSYPQIEPYHTATVSDSADQDGDPLYQNGDPPYCTLETYYNIVPQPEAGAHRRNKYDNLERKEDYV